MEIGSRDCGADETKLSNPVDVARRYVKVAGSETATALDLFDRTKS